MFQRIFLTALFFALSIPSAAVAKTSLVLYSALEPEMVTRYTKAFNEKYPDIELKWVRDSVGPITARLLAEKDAPQADIAFGMALSAIMFLDGEGLFQAYKPAGFDEVATMMRDDRQEPVWAAMTAWAMALCINKPELEKMGLPVPETWGDLLNPIYKGLIVMPNPVSSSTGYMAISGWFYSMGEEKAWHYMKQLDENVKMYTHSGAKPAQMAAQGETVIGISSSSFAMPLMARKAPLSLVEPKDGLGWDMEGVAILKGAKNLEAAQKLMDFAVSPEVAKIAAEGGYIPNRLEMALPELMATYDLLLPIDFKQSAAKKDERLKRWRETFERDEE